MAGAEWIDNLGHRARDRLVAAECEPVIGHCDWLASNLRWSGDTLLVVHDWDSMIADSEAVLVAGTPDDGQTFWLWDLNQFTDGPLGRLPAA